MRGRRKERASRGGAERERETQNPKYTPGSELLAQSPTGDSKVTNREPKWNAQATEPPRRPFFVYRNGQEKVESTGNGNVITGSNRNLRHDPRRAWRNRVLGNSKILEKLRI